MRERCGRALSRYARKKVSPMKDFIIRPAVQMLVATLIAAVVIVAFATHQTSALGSALSAVASIVGMFCYRAGWLYGSDTTPPPPPPPAPPPADPAAAVAPDEPSVQAEPAPTVAGQ